MVLDEHVTTKHMADLKKLTDEERRDFLQKYIKDESKMLYPDYHRLRFQSDSLKKYKAWEYETDYDNMYFWACWPSRIPTVKLEIPGKEFLKSESRTSVTFKL